MKHRGRASRSAWKLIFWTLVLLLAMLAGGVVAAFVSSLIAAISTVLIAVWILFSVFTLYFFRDPEPIAPSIKNVIVAPASGKVDVIDEVTEPEFMGGACQRISVFLSLFDVHVQRAPLAGTVEYLQHKPGKFASTTRALSAAHNENVLVGIESADYPGQKVAVRLIAGVLARRAIPYISLGESLERSERISLIQYGSRCDLYLPRGVKLHIECGEKVKAGETIVASLE